MKTIRHENRLWVLVDDHLKALEVARKAAAIVEREECAKVCDRIWKDDWQPVVGVCAAKIRARGEK